MNRIVRELAVKGVSSQRIRNHDCVVVKLESKRTGGVLEFALLIKSYEKLGMPAVGDVIICTLKKKERSQHEDLTS